MDSGLPDTPRQGKAVKGKPPRGTTSQGRLARTSSSSDCAPSTSAAATAPTSFLYSPRLWQAAGQQHKVIPCDRSLFFPGLFQAPVLKAVPSEPSEETPSAQPSKRAKVTNSAGAGRNNNRSSRDGSAESNTPPGTPIRARQQQQPLQPPQRQRLRYVPQDDVASSIEERRNSHAGASASNSSQGGVPRRRSSEDGCHSADSDASPWPFVVPNKGLRSSRSRAPAPLQPRILAGLDLTRQQRDDSHGGQGEGEEDEMEQQEDAVHGDVHMAEAAAPVQQAVAALRQSHAPSLWQEATQGASVQQQLAQLADLLAANHPCMPQMLQPVAPQQQHLPQQQQQQHVSIQQHIAFLQQQQQHQQQQQQQQQVALQTQQQQLAQQCASVFKSASAAAPQPPQAAMLADPAAQLALDAVAALMAQSGQVTAANPAAAGAVPAASILQASAQPAAGRGAETVPSVQVAAAAVTALAPAQPPAFASDASVAKVKAAATPMDIGIDTAQLPVLHAVAAAAMEVQHAAEAGPFSTVEANTSFPTEPQQQQPTQPQPPNQQLQQKGSLIILETSQDSEQTCHGSDSPNGGPAATCTAACTHTAARGEAMQPLALRSWPSGDSNMLSESDSEQHEGSHNSHGDVRHTHTGGGCSPRKQGQQQQLVRDDGKLARLGADAAGHGGGGSGCAVPMCVSLAIGSVSGSPSSPLTSDVF